MWTAENQKHYDWKGLRHPSDQTDAEQALAKPFIAVGKFAPPQWEARLRAVLDGVLYVLTTGCQWWQLPKDFPPRSTVHGWLVRWHCDGVLDRLRSSAVFALGFFAYRVGLNAGMRAAAMGGLDGFVFTAGIRENSPTMRARIAQRLAWFGIKRDIEANRERRTVISAQVKSRSRLCRADQRGTDDRAPHTGSAFQTRCARTDDGGDRTIIPVARAFGREPPEGRKPGLSDKEWSSSHAARRRQWFMRTSLGRPFHKGRYGGNAAKRSKTNAQDQVDDGIIHCGVAAKLPAVRQGRAHRRFAERRNDVRFRRLHREGCDGSRRRAPLFAADGAPCQPQA